MRFHSTMDRKKFTDDLIADLRETADLYPVIAKVLQAYDGKVFNCRLQKALQDATGARIFAEKKTKFIEIYIYTSRQRECRTLATLSIDAMQDGKRINAAAFIEDARERRAKHLQRAAQIAQQVQQAQQIKDQVLQLQKALQAITEPLAWEVREIYGLNYRITNY